MARTKRTACPVEAYARAVVADEIVAGRLVRLACERHLRDLAEGPARGLRWDQAAAERIIKFAAFLRLPGDKPFVLEPFQVFVVGSLFGWKGPDGYRRYRVGYIEMGKGNGKSPVAGLIGLYGMIADGEPAAEIYAAATKKDQAMILFRDAVQLVNASPYLKKIIKQAGKFPGVWNLSYEKAGAFFRPIASEDGQSGPRPHIGLLDEIHEHKSALVIDMMRAGTKSRKQALIVEITNSGHDRTSVCWAHHDYSAQVLAGTIENDAWFGYVCTLDPCDECRAKGAEQPVQGCTRCDQVDDGKVWAKANPGLDTILPRKYLAEQLAEIQGIASKRNNVLRLNFCIWTEAESRAIAQDQWDACAGTKDPIAWRKRMLEELRGQECYGGLDLGSVGDLSSLGLIFPPREERKKWILLSWFWCPEVSTRVRWERDRFPYPVWVDQGFLTETPGNVTDYDFVRRDIRDLGSRFNIVDLAIDRWQATHLTTQLQGDGFEITAFGQGFADMGGPVRRLLEDIAGAKLEHGANPVLWWNAANAVTAEDPAGLLKFDKSKSMEKIDGIVAATMARGLAMKVDLETSGAGGGAEFWD